MSSGGFVATHVAPPDGLQAWDAPDPTRPVVAQVQPGVRMQLMEQRGAWGHVLFSNGWSGWVDARRLVAAPAPGQPPQAAPQFRPQPPPQTAQPAPAAQPAQPAQPAPTAQPAQPAPRPHEPDPFQLPPQDRPETESMVADTETGVWSAQPEPEQARAPAPQPEAKPARTSSGGAGFSLDGFKLSAAPIGAVVVLIGTLLPWISITGFSGNAFRVPMKFLIDYKTQGSGLKVGLLLVAAAVVAGVFCVLPGRVALRRAMGGVVIVIAVVYSIQLQRVLSSGGDAAPSLTSAIGFGVLVAIGGGVALIIDKSEPAGG